MRDWSKVEIVYDPAHKMTYGLWVCPFCFCQFYGGGPALHKEGCLNKVDYMEMIHVIGPEGIKRIKEGYATMDGLSLEILKKSKIGPYLLNKEGRR